MKISNYKIKTEQVEVGHVAHAVAENGTIVESAIGFGVEDAKRQLKIKIEGATSVYSNTRKVLINKPSKKRVFKPASVNFSAKNNIERYKAKRAGKK